MNHDVVFKFSTICRQAVSWTALFFASAAGTYFFLHLRDASKPGRGGAAAQIRDQSEKRDMAAVQAQIALLREQTDKHRREARRIDKELRDFRAACNMESMHSQIALLEKTRENNFKDVLDLGRKISADEKLLDILRSAKSNPSKLGFMPDGLADEELKSAFNAWNAEVAELRALLTRYTPAHPEVAIKTQEREVCREVLDNLLDRRIAECSSALETDRAKCAEKAESAKKAEEEIAALSQRIADAKSKIARLESDLAAENSLLEECLQKENEAKADAAAN